MIQSSGKDWENGKIIRKTTKCVSDLYSKVKLVKIAVN